MEQIRISQCTNHNEWESAKYFRNEYFFKLNNIDDPYTWTFNHPLHRHFIMYSEQKTVGYAHIQLWKDSRAAIRIIVIDLSKRDVGLGSKFLHLCEKSLKDENYKTIHAESSPAALKFYKRNGYIKMPFNDPDGYESSKEDIAVGKKL